MLKLFDRFLRKLSGPPAPRDQMRDDWNQRAREDARFFIASAHADTEEAFRASGAKDLDALVLDGIELPPTSSALEIGCGVGRLLVPLAARVAHVGGVDISDVMIRKARKFCGGHRNITARTTKGDLAGFADGSLDLVFSFIVFQHIPDRTAIRRYVEEAARVLRPGGVFRFQVDGRRWRWVDRAAGTYDGHKFTPADARALLDGTGLRVVDEWGADTHYHWLTTVKTGGVPPRLRQRRLDPVVLREMLAAVRADPSEEDRALRGEVSLRRLLQPLESGARDRADAAFLQALTRGLLGRDPTADESKTHLDILVSHVEEREDLLDILMMGEEFRELVRPFADHVPWDRLEAIREACPGLDPGASYFEVVDAATAALDPADAVGSAYALVLGQAPDGEARRHHERIAASHPLGRRLVVRHLLNSPGPPHPEAAPPRETIDRLARRLGVEVSPGPAAPGESFPCEARLARSVLSTADEDAGGFVRRAYAAVLGREPDPDGAAWYRGRLESGQLNRPGLVRELLRSEELRKR